MNRRQLLAAALTPLAWRVASDALPSTAFAATAERDGKMSKTTQRIIECNGIRLNIAEQGEGPLVLLVHGFPEAWFSWRHQIDTLAAAGFRVVAPDMRGYGKSDAPQAIDQYTILHLVGDMVGILDALSHSVKHAADDGVGERIDGDVVRAFGQNQLRRHAARTVEVFRNVVVLHHELAVGRSSLRLSADVACATRVQVGPCDCDQVVVRNVAGKRNYMARSAAAVGINGVECDETVRSYVHLVIRVSVKGEVEADLRFEMRVVVAFQYEVLWGRLRRERN